MNEGRVGWREGKERGKGSGAEGKLRKRTVKRWDDRGPRKEGTDD